MIPMKMQVKIDRNIKGEIEGLYASCIYMHSLDRVKNYGKGKVVYSMDKTWEDETSGALVKRRLSHGGGGGGTNL